MFRTAILGNTTGGDMPLKLMAMLLFVALCAGSVLGAKLVEATVSAYRSVEAA